MAPQRLAITHQNDELIAHTRLGYHSTAQQVFKAEHGEQQAEGRVRWRLAQIGVQQLIERLAVGLPLLRGLQLGKTLRPSQRALADQDREDRDQQHPPLREADAPEHPAVRQRLEKADQIDSSGRVGGGLRDQLSGAVPSDNTVGV